MRWPGLLPGLVKHSVIRQWPGEPLLPDSGTCRTSGVLKIADCHPLLFLCLLGWPGLTILGDPSSSGTYTHGAEVGASFLATQGCVLFTQLGCFLNLYTQSSHVPKPSRVPLPPGQTSFLALAVKNLHNGVYLLFQISLSLFPQMIAVLVPNIPSVS